MQGRVTVGTLLYAFLYITVCIPCNYEIMHAMWGHNTYIIDARYM